MRIITRNILLLALFLHVMTVIETSFTSAEETKTGKRSVAEMESSIFESVNRIRQENGLRPLRVSPKLQDMARLQSLDMVRHKSLRHVNSRGEDLKKRAAGINLRNWRRLGENVVRTFGFERHAETMVKEWLNSRHHRENIMNGDFDTTGIGVVQECGGYYYATQIFMQTAN